MATASIATAKGPFYSVKILADPGKSAQNCVATLFERCQLPMIEMAN
jgi:hypothetical protein